MIEFKYSGDKLYARMERAVERVSARQRKTVEILEAAKIEYAIVGGNAVRASAVYCLLVGKYFMASIRSKPPR